MAARQVDVVQEHIARVGRTGVTVTVETPLTVDFTIAIRVGISSVVDTRGASRARIARVVIVAVARILARRGVARVIVIAGIVAVQHGAPFLVSFAATRVRSDQ